MTLQHDALTDVFGLAGTFPRPGWVVLDAARDHRFTGELVFDTSPGARVYFDRGVIYLAERISDPSLGSRLVDAGTLSAVQLERGSVRIGPIEHLGRLFERVPGLDRHTVIVTAELMTEECIGWLAAQRVVDVASAPYRHHASGMHQWGRGATHGGLVAGDPLPAPTPDEAPVSFSPPLSGVVAPVADRTEDFLDGLIQWDEPSWFDGSELERELTDPRAGSRVVHSTDHGARRHDGDLCDHPADPDGDPSTGSGAPELAELLGAQSDSLHPGDVHTDWVDRLVVDGLPEADPLLPPKPLPRLPIEPVERFELVWPSGEIDEDFGAVDSVVGDGHDPDADRIGATARLARPVVAAATQPLPEPAHPPVIDTTEEPESGQDADVADDVVLAVRRAVASIDVGSLVARKRLVDTNGGFGTGLRGSEPDNDSSGVAAPGRVAVRSGRNDWSRRTVTRSVFDEPPVEHAVEPEPAEVAVHHGERRVGALRRLIASLRN